MRGFFDVWMRENVDTIHESYLRFRTSIPNP